MLPGMELMGCQGLAVPPEVMHHVVRVESSYNPYAIGVVGGRLVRQPKNLPEALSTVRMLESRGYNFSIGLAQVNRYNLDKYGLDSYEKAFEPCANLQAGSKILAECYGRSGGDWGKSFSCYYSGNFSTGFRHGYVQKIYASIRQGQPEDDGGAPAIQVVSRGTRRSVPVTRYPLFAAAQLATEPAVSAPRLPSRIEPVPSRRIVAPDPEIPQPAMLAEQAPPVVDQPPPVVVPDAVTVAPTISPRAVESGIVGLPQAVPSQPGGVVRLAATSKVPEAKPAEAKSEGPAPDRAFVF